METQRDVANPNASGGKRAVWPLLWPSAPFICFFLLGLAGVIISFFKHGTSALIGFLSYGGLAWAAFWFLGASRKKHLSSTDAAIRLFILSVLASLPNFVNMLRK